MFFIVYWRSLLTKISRVLVRAKTRTVSNNEMRLLWWGRVVEKNLKRILQSTIIKHKL